MKILHIKGDNEIRYVFEAMKGVIKKPFEHSRQWIQKCSKIKIPLPPTKKQKEIVEIFEAHEAYVQGYEEYLKNLNE